MMRVRAVLTALVLRCSLLVFAAALVSSSAFAQAHHRGQAIRSMKLLTPNIGWVVTPYRIYWTTNGGAGWTDITPPVPRRTRIASVFFLNASTGWALLVSPRYVGNEPRFSLASTTTGGASWSITRVAMPGLGTATTPLVPAGHVAFADSLHGWMNLGLQSSSNFDAGLLLVTADAGRTWQPVTRDVAGSIGLVTTDEGWLVGGPDDLRFYMTHDGAKSWQRIALPAPAGIYSVADPMQVQVATKPAYGLPTFRDAKDGFVVATYSGYSPVKSAAVLFKTMDGGRTWKPDKIITGLPEGTVGWKLSSAVADSTWVVAKTRREKLPTLLKFNKGLINAGSIASDCVQGMACLVNAQISFVTPMRGWLLKSDGTLLSTADAGASWNTITPNLNPHSAASAGPSSSAAAMVLSGSTGAMATAAPASPILGTLGTSQHLGFDHGCGVPSTSIMQTWWNSSPYFDAAIYANGAASQCGGTDKNLKSKWVSTVLGYGWGLIPIWDGPQAPCACDPNIPGGGPGPYPDCNAYPNTFATDLVTAASDGMTQAALAASSVSSLGLAGTVIYYDMENYNSSYDYPLNSPPNTCGQAVVAFLGGWVSGLHAAGFRAAVYGSGSNVGPDFVQVSPLPDDVWIGSSPGVTVWGIQGSGYSLPDSTWANHQRLRQFDTNLTETWGGSQLNIDKDIEDGDVVAGKGTKSYTYTFVTQKEDVSGAFETDPQAMNGGGPLGAIGDVAGYYLDSNINEHGFYDTTGTPVSFDCAGAADTVAWGINDFETIVGSYVASNTTNDQGFSYNIGGSCTTIDYPGATSTTAFGINDAGWIVGTYTDSSNANHGFLYKNGQFSSFDYPGGSNTFAADIDGVGRIIGYACSNPPTCTSLTGFVDDAGSSAPASGTFTPIAYPGAIETHTYSVNNNGQVTGLETTDSGGVYTSDNFLFYNGGFTNIDQLITINDLAGINDQAQIVGTSTLYDGFIAIPQY